MKLMAGRVASLLREAVASARSQPVASIVTMAIVAGMCATVLLTTGRTVGAEQAVVSSIDQAGTRSIVIRAELAAGLDSSVIDRLSGIEGIEWAGGFGSASDVTNAEVTDGSRVPLRHVWSTDNSEIGLGVTPESISAAWGTADALEAAGLVDAVGTVTDRNGNSFSVMGGAELPRHLSFLKPVFLAPAGDSEADALSILVVVAESSSLVAPVARAVQSVLGVDDVTRLTVETSEGLATLRGLIESQLSAFSRSLVLLAFAVSAGLVGVVMYGLVTMRRRDFGRRRALGASQHWIVVLLIAQTTLVASIGATVGTLTSLLVMVASADPLPGWQFSIAVTILSVFIAGVGALVPAIVAARRDPLTELRVP